MTKNALLITTLAIGLVATGYQVHRYRNAAQAATKASSISAAELAVFSAFERETVLRDAGLLTGDDPLEVSRAVRDWVYRTNKIGNGETHKSEGALIYANLGKPGHEQLCGGMAAAYYWALTRVGVPARIVQLATQSYLGGDDNGGTHVTVETYIDGRWRVSDPTFNVGFRCSTDEGQALSITDMKQCIESGGGLIARAGKTQISGRTIADYYLPYKELLSAYARTAVSMPEISTPAEQYPDGWLY